MANIFHIWLKTPALLSLMDLLFLLFSLLTRTLTSILSSIVPAHVSFPMRAFVTVDEVCHYSRGEKRGNAENQKNGASFAEKRKKIKR